MRSEPAAPPTDAVPTDVAAQLRAAGCVFADDEARLLHASAATPGELAAMVASRVDGTPLEHVLGWAAFCGLRIDVDPGVFVPRRRTELMVRVAVGLVDRGAVVVDLCCGSGAVGTAVTAAIGAVDLHAVDIDPVACACAQRNVAAAGGRVHVGDLYAPLPSGLRGHVDLVLANAPYVPTGDLRLLPREARLHEARIALDGGRDGLDIQRRIVAAAPQWLAADGHVLIETVAHQAQATMDLLHRAGMHAARRTSAELDAMVIVGSHGPLEGR